MNSEWIEIKNARDLCHAIVSGNKIRVVDETSLIEDDGDYMKIKSESTKVFNTPFTTEIIDKLYDYKHMFRYRMEYKEGELDEL